eukprot:maker-scaffold140_size315649-snap-gene-2.24 protein:Tk03581 transcript:maker-scaffold140_size315649-snap-gene-2.24-mRNA-1 annotation:"neurogenic locus notch homolog protein 1-like"
MFILSHSVDMSKGADVDHWRWMPPMMEVPHPDRFNWIQTVCTMLEVSPMTEHSFAPVSVARYTPSGVSLEACQERLHLGLQLKLELSLHLCQRDLDLAHGGWSPSLGWHHWGWLACRWEEGGRDLNVVLPCLSGDWPGTIIDGDLHGAKVGLRYHLGGGALATATRLYPSFPGTRPRRISMKFLFVLPFVVGVAFAYSSGAPSCDVEMPGHQDDNGAQIQFQSNTDASGKNIIPIVYTKTQTGEADWTIVINAPTASASLKGLRISTSTPGQYTIHDEANYQLATGSEIAECVTHSNGSVKKGAQMFTFTSEAGEPQFTIFLVANHQTFWKVEV